MSLIARHFEASGLPTLIIGSALDILEAGRPPRVQFLNYPLGFEAGPFQDKSAQLDVIRQGLKGFELFKAPGINKLTYTWNEGWDLVRNRENSEQGDDQRSPRNTEPQYQTDEDRLAAQR